MKAYQVYNPQTFCATSIKTHEFHTILDNNMILQTINPKKKHILLKYINFLAYPMIMPSLLWFYLYGFTLYLRFSLPIPIIFLLFLIFFLFEILKFLHNLFASNFNSQNRHKIATTKDLSSNKHNLKSTIN